MSIIVSFLRKHVSDLKIQISLKKLSLAVVFPAQSLGLSREKNWDNFSAEREALR
jgi:hypothetical protein